MSPTSRSSSLSTFRVGTLPFVVRTLEGPIAVLVLDRCPHLVSSSPIGQVNRAVPVAHEVLLLSTSRLECNLSSVMFDEPLLNSQFVGLRLMPRPCGQCLKAGMVSMRVSRQWDL
ncbi:hypothetical protein PENTCL1PPCAC_21368, partial [Pristionchus entomophagus]